MKTNHTFKEAFNRFHLFSLIIALVINSLSGQANSNSLLINCAPNAPICAGDDATICAGQTHAVVATAVCSHQNNVFTWTTLGDGLFNNSNALSTFYTPGNNDISNGSVDLIITRTAAGGPCVANEADTLTLSIVSLPTTPIATISTSTVCSGLQFQLFATTVSGASYNWTGPNGFSSTQQNPVISSATTNNTGSYSVTATVGNCTSLPSNSVSITVNQTPNTPTPSSNSPVCEGSTLNLSVGNLANVSFSWTGPNGFTSNIQQPSITSVSSAATGTYTLTVTSNNGNCASNPGSVNVVVNPLPNITITPSALTICSGQSTSINLSSTAPNPSFSWTVNPNNVGATNGNGSTISQTLTNPGANPASATYTVTPSANGCSGTPSAIIVTVNPAPAANAGTTQTICQGSTLQQLNGSVTGSATGGIWSSNIPNDTFSDENSLNSAWTPPAGFFGNAILTLTTTGQTAPCAAATSTVTISVLATPTATVGDNQQICQGGTTAVLEGAVNGSATGGIWSSNIPDDTFSNDNLASTTWTPPASFNGIAELTLITTGMEPCAADTAFVEITVLPTPIVSVGSNQTICQGESTLPLNGSTDGSATGGLWTSDSQGSFSDPTDLNTIWTPPSGFEGTATLTLTTTGMAPCDAVSEDITVLVNPNLSAEVSFENNPFCLSLSTVQIPEITGVTNGTFSSPTGLSINTTTGNINPSLSEPGVYNVIYTVPGLDGCPDFEYPIEVVVAPIPDALLLPDFPNFICENSSVVFEVNDSPFNPYTAFEWALLDSEQNPIGTIEENNGQSILYSIENQTGEITINIVLTETIGTCSTTSEIPITVRVNPETCGYFELAGDVLAACSELGSYYQWGCGTTAITGETSNSFVHTAFSQLNSCDAFWVQVSLYDDFSCPVYLGDASQITGIADEILSNQLLLFPNPASGVVTLKYDRPIIQSGLIEIFNVTGKVCYSGTITPGLGNLQQTIDISNLSSGSYILSLTLNDGRAIKSFVVSK